MLAQETLNTESKAFEKFIANTLEKKHSGIIYTKKLLHESFARKFSTSVDSV